GGQKGALTCRFYHWISDQSPSGAPIPPNADAAIARANERTGERSTPTDTKQPTTIAQSLPKPDGAWAPVPKTSEREETSEWFKPPMGGGAASALKPSRPSTMIVTQAQPSGTESSVVKAPVPDSGCRGSGSSIPLDTAASRPPSPQSIPQFVIPSTDTP